MFNSIKQLKKLNRTKLSDNEWYETDSNGRGIIDVGAENYDDIFSYYDLDGENVLDREFDEFLEAKADAIPLKQEIAIHFHVKNATDTKLEEMEHALKNHFKREVRAAKRRLRRNFVFVLYMVFMGLASLGLCILLKHFNAPETLIYVFDIATWVFWWEAVDQFFLHRHELKQTMLKKFRFVRADISVIEYRAKKKKQAKFGNNAKSLNNILKQVDKDNKKIEKKIEKLN